MWTLPGGGLEFGEHPEAGMIREVHEETGLNVLATGLVGVHSFTRDKDHEAFQSIQIIYKTKVVEGSLRHEQQGTTDMCKWQPLQEIDNLKRVELVDIALSMSAKERT